MRMALDLARDPEAVLAAIRAAECEPHPFGEGNGLADGTCWCHAGADARWHLRWLPS